MSLPIPSPAALPVRLLQAVCLLLCGLLAPCGVQAHVSGFTDTSIQVAATGVRLIYTLPQDSLRELDGAPRTAGDAPAPPEAYLQAVRRGWTVESGGERCLLTQASARAMDKLPSYQFQLSYVCPRGLHSLGIGYGLFLHRWRDHENFVRVFMADQRMRMRFTVERTRLDLPVDQLLAQWGRPLAPGFFDGDPNRGLQDALQGRPEAGLPRIVTPDASLGALRLGQIDPGFVHLGLQHIFMGLDHVLFVVGLVLITHAWRQLLLLVSAFTLAHTVTLALSTLGVVDIPTRWAEPLIALTIVYIGLESLWLLRRPREAGAPGPAAASRGQLARRAALVFLFGLVHGVGFSYVLREMGLREDLLGALLAFNLGVEAGQLAIIAVALPVVLLWRRLSWGPRLAAAASAAVAGVGVAMFLSRVAA